MTSPGRVGVLGGTFDPIHIGHLAAAEDTAQQLQLDHVLFVPNRLPPHKRDRAVTAAEDRAAMVELAIENNPRFQLSRIELDREGPSYTLDTMRQLRSTLGPDVQLFFLTGCDSLRDLHSWHEPDALLREFCLVIMDRPRPGEFPWKEVERRFPGIQNRVTFVEIPLLQISSSDLRQRAAEGRPVRYYLTPAVERYIRDRRLYLR